MPLTPFPIREFGGLNLAADPLDVGATGAADCSDVAFEIVGQVRARSGYTAVATTSTAPQTMHVYTSVGASTNLLTSSATKLEAFDAFGTAIASVSATGAHAFTNAGSDSDTLAFAVGPNDSSVRKWDGSAWSTVSAAPGSGRCVAFDPDSSRLVIAGHGGGHRIQWSDPGDYTTWGTNNFVDFSPGDGEFITAVAVWQGYVFIFKQTKIAVFYSETTNADGDPIFNYRTFDGIGAVQGVGNGTAVSTPQGVYFLSNDGLYVSTNASTPRPVAPQLASLFLGGDTPALGCSLAWHRGRLVFNLLMLGGYVGTFVWFQATDAWSKWTLQVGKDGGAFIGGDDIGFTQTGLYWVNGTDSKIFAMFPNDTADDGADIDWSYSSGFYPLPGANSMGESRCRYTDVWGSGTVTVQTNTLGGRPSDVADPGGAVTLGTAPAIDRGRYSRSARGRWFQHVLSGTGPAVVSSIDRWVSG